MQVTQSYGVKTNEALLQFYGFVDTDNVNDAYTTDMTDWVKAHYGVLEERWQFLATDGIAMQSLQQVCSLCRTHLSSTLDLTFM